jgi:hypothetical protein
MSIVCRNGQEHRHGSVQEVRDCYAGKAVQSSQAPTPAVRSNKYAGNCAACNNKVAEGEGTVEKADGRWNVRHLPGQCPAPAASPEPATGKRGRKPFPNVPAGHYATKSLTGNNDLDFWRVDRPEQGQWAGRTFVKRVIGGKPNAPVRGRTMFAALEAILEAGVDVAGTLYGTELGQCRKCNRHLTDETSRALGIGPDCRSQG